MLINGGNPIPFSVEAVGEGLYAVRAVQPIAFPTCMLTVCHR